MKTWDAIYQEWQTDDGQIHAQRMGLLIRCKDCRYNADCICVWHSGNDYTWVVVDDDYCSCAERKEQ